MRFRLLGTLEVIADDGTPVAIPARKRRALLAVLLLRRGRSIQREALIDALWGEAAPDAASESLFAHVSRLRREIGATAIQRVPGGYLLPVEDDQLDVLAFEREVAAGRQELALRRWHAATATLGAALERWQGPALAEFSSEPFAQPEIVRLEELRIGALEDRIDADLAIRREHDVVPELEQLVQEHPLRERLWGQLLVALYRSGRQSEALERYRELRRTLLAQLGLDPSPELQELQRRILVQDPGLDVTEPSERQAAPDLPAYPTRTVGRRREIEIARATLSSSRLLTLTGPGGVGKTRLAVLVAETLLSEYREDIRFVDLSMVRDPEQVLERIGALVGGGGRPEEAIGERRMLLVLDNFEQVLDASASISHLIGRCPGLRVIITSRAPLRIAAEQQLDVPPLDSADSAELFIDRAAAAVAAEALPTEAVREVVARLDGLPLALELAAARVKVLTISAIRDFLADRMSFLTAGQRDAPDRHRTLRDTIRWSYELLAPEARAVFRKLSVLAPGFDVEAAFAVGEAGLDEVAELVDHSLLRRVEDRYAMLETIRAFAEGAASGPEATAAHERHLRHFTALPLAARDRVAQLAGSLQQGADEWLDVCASNQENLRLAFEWARATGDAQAMVSLLRGVGAYWAYLGTTEEALRWAEMTLERSEGLPPADLERVRVGAAEFARFSDQLPLALSLLQSVLDGATERADLVRIANTLDDLANTYASMDRETEALALLGRAHETHRQEPNCDPRHLGHTLEVEMFVLLRLGRVDEAEETSKAYVEVNSTRPGWTLRNLESELVLAALAAAAGRRYDARAGYGRVVVAASRGQFRGMIADALDGLAGIDRDERPGDAAMLLGMADRARAESRSTVFFAPQRRALIDGLRETLGPDRYEAARSAGEGVPVIEMAAAALPSKPELVAEPAARST
ncbi:MAG TPA: BTAD domain-containing putative transcriptional regulator [Candidatus Limnocylindrales bacterium]